MVASFEESFRLDGFDGIVYDVYSQEWIFDRLSRGRLTAILLD